MELSKAHKLAAELMEEFGLRPRWRFKFDKARKRFGCCKLRRKTITLSAHLTKLNDRSEVEDVIRHEIAHALDYEDRGTSDHSEKWKEWAREVGARPERYYDSEKVNNVYRHYDYCPNCGWRRGKHRRSLRGKLASCNKCSKKFTLDYLIVTNIPPSTMDAIDSGVVDWRDTAQARTLMNKIRFHYQKHEWESSLIYERIQNRQEQPKKKVASESKPKNETQGKPLSEVIDNIVRQGGGYEDMLTKINEAAKERGSNTLTVGSLKAHIKYRLKKDPTFYGDSFRIGDHGIDTFSDPT